jgi:hypothetical protein
MWAGRGCTGFDVTEGVVFDDGFGNGVFPSFAKEGIPFSSTHALNDSVSRAGNISPLRG